MPSRERRHDRWTDGDVRVIVATVAFGMGINKANVRFVLHFSMPKSLRCVKSSASACPDRSGA